MGSVDLKHQAIPEPERMSWKKETAFLGPVASLPPVPSGWLRFERGWLNTDQLLKNLETVVSLLQKAQEGVNGIDALLNEIMTVVNAHLAQGVWHRPPPEELEGHVRMRLNQINEIVRQCRFHGRGLLDGQCGVVGIGLGGSADLAMRLAKEAIFRPIGTRNPDPQIADLEAELLAAINKTGIGPMGLGGDTTAFAVHIEEAHTHITMNPVGINFQCWRGERASATLYPDGRVEYGY